MKIAIAVILATELVASLCLQAQGTLYVSNLGQTPIGNTAIGSDSWVAQDFFTGTNSDGYVLNSVQLLMDASSGNPDGFTISIYSYDNTSMSPGSKLGSLTGLDPSVGGIFTYTAPGITLLPGLYLVVVTADTPVAQGAYNWSSGPGAGQGGDIRGDDGWDIGHLYYTSPDGLNWNYSREQYFQMAIYATPIPEPSTLSLLFLGSGILIYFRKHVRFAAGKR
jgi:PEP-CTERM motif